MSELLLTVPEAAKVLRLSTKSVYKLAREKVIPSTRIPGLTRVLIPRQQLEDWITNQTDEGPGPQPESLRSATA